MTVNTSNICFAASRGPPPVRPPKVTWETFCPAPKQS